MLDSLRICIRSLANQGRRFLKQFVATSNKSKKKKPKRRYSSENTAWLASPPFSATDLLSSQLKQVFKFIDVNGDGKICPSDMSETLLSLGHDKSTASNIATRMVKEMDSNGDGFVDLDEFMSTVQDQHYSSGTGDASNDKDALMDAFLVFDSDKNGFISAEELQQVLISLGCKNCSINRCRRMIGGVDKDGNGFVDFEEFKSMMCVGTDL